MAERGKDPYAAVRELLARADGDTEKRMKLGDLNLASHRRHVPAGRRRDVRRDPASRCGSEVAPADERNRILLAMNSLLIRAAGKWILVETGAGDKWDAKRADIYAFERAAAPAGKTGDARRSAGKDRHRDQHASAFRSLRLEHAHVNGEAVPTFPNARYIVQRGELEHARHRPRERDRASYFPENFDADGEIGQWSLLEGDAEIVPGVEVDSRAGPQRAT